jgi:hypothetical protein
MISFSFRVGVYKQFATGKLNGNLCTQVVSSESAIDWLEIRCFNVSIL